MPWPRQCAHCGSMDIQAGIDEIMCLDCGGLTDKDGHAVSQQAQYTSEEKIEF